MCAPPVLLQLFPEYRSFCCRLLWEGFWGARLCGEGLSCEGTFFWQCLVVNIRLLMFVFIIERVVKC